MPEFALFSGPAGATGEIPELPARAAMHAILIRFQDVRLTGGPANPNFSVQRLERARRLFQCDTDANRPPPFEWSPVPCAD
jgi:hypothetical protein